jgi:riboflavin biosynthesis pyrimidine reductase
MPAVRLSRPYGTTELLEGIVVQARQQAIAAGLVDEYQMFVVPAVVGGGTRALPDQVRLNLALAEERRFGSGTVYLCYRPA